MIQLYQFERVWNIPNLSHFCAKIETYLRMTHLPYETVATLPAKGPKGKLPYLEEDGKKICDSHFIIDYLKNAHGDPLDAHLSDAERAVATAMQRLIEEHFFWVTMYARWYTSKDNWTVTKQAIFGGLPPVIRDVAAWTYRRLIIRKQIYGHGMGRHKADEIFHLGEQDCDALSAFLGDKRYFMGDRPTSLDATAYGFLINTLAPPVESPIKDYALGKTNLKSYCERMTTEFFPEFKT